MKSPEERHKTQRGSSAEGQEVESRVINLDPLLFSPQEATAPLTDQRSMFMSSSLWKGLTQFRVLKADMSCPRRGYGPNC